MANESKLIDCTNHNNQEEGNFEFSSDPVDSEDIKNMIDSSAGGCIKDPGLVGRLMGLQSLPNNKSNDKKYIPPIHASLAFHHRRLHNNQCNNLGHGFITSRLSNNHIREEVEETADLKRLKRVHKKKSTNMERACHHSTNFGDGKRSARYHISEAFLHRKTCRDVTVNDQHIDHVACVKNNMDIRSDDQDYYIDQAEDEDDSSQNDRFDRMDRQYNHNHKHRDYCDNEWSSMIKERRMKLDAKLMMFRDANDSMRSHNYNYIKKKKKQRLCNASMEWETPWFVRQE